MSIKEIIKKWIGVDADVRNAEEKVRKEVTEQLTAEKDSAVKKVTAEKDSVTDQYVSDIKRLEGKLNELQAAFNRTDHERIQLNEQLLAEKDSNAKRLESFNGELAKAREDEHSKVVEQLTAEKVAAVRRVEEEKATLVQKLVGEKNAAIERLNAAHGKEVSDLNEKWKAAEEEWKQNQKRYAAVIELLENLTAAKNERLEKKGVGRPKLDRVTKSFTIDQGLNAIIGFLEKSGVIKKGEMTREINEHLWQWVDVYKQQLDDFYGGDAAVSRSEPQRIPPTMPQA